MPAGLQVVQARVRRRGSLMVLLGGFNLFLIMMINESIHYDENFSLLCGGIWFEIPDFNIVGAGMPLSHETSYTKKS